MPRLPLAPARRRPRRQLFVPMAAGLAARRIQAAARGFLARRQVARMRRPRLMSPMDISKMKRRKTQGQVKTAARGVMPKYRIGSLIGTAKSKRKVTGKMDPLKVTSHSDRCCNIDQTMVAYWGFADASSQDDQLKQGVRALVQMFVRRAGLKVSTVDQQFNDSYLYNSVVDNKIRLDRIIIQYVRRGPDGKNGEIREVAYSVTEASSVTTISDTLFDDIKAKAAGPDSTGLGEYPVRAVLQSKDIYAWQDPEQTFYRAFATYDLSNCMVDFTYMRKFKWQNVTPADNTLEPGNQSRYNLNDVHANPLSGKIYHFKGPVPVVRAAQLDNGLLPNLPNLSASIYEQLIGPATVGTSRVDGSINCAGFRDNGDYTGTLYNAFQQPFKAQTFFKNVETEDKVYMPPGGYKQLIRKGKVTMSFTRFCKATVCPATGSTGSETMLGIEPMPPKIGGCTIWGLEPAVRTSPDESSRIAMNMETWLSAKIRVGEQKVPIAKIHSVTTTPNFS
ncbi:MAG: putative capsid protein [Cressdnaviricota sp.]|nr:MAG: putative capsid protein [Cressdnaviricota sp.]